MSASFATCMTTPTTLPSAEHGTAAVARVDRAVDLAGEQLGVGVDVGLALDARHDAPRHAQRVAAEREAEDQDLLSQLGKAAELQRRDLVEEARLVDGQESEVGLVGDVEHAGGHPLGLAVPSHLDEGRVAHHVRVREDAVARDHEPGARDRARGAGLPGRPVVRGQLGRVDLHDGVRGLGRARRSESPRQKESREKEGGDDLPCLLHSTPPSHAGPWGAPDPRDGPTSSRANPMPTIGQTAQRTEAKGIAASAERRGACRLCRFPAGKQPASRRKATRVDHPIPGPVPPA